MLITVFNFVRPDRWCAFLFFRTRTSYVFSTSLNIAGIIGSLGRCLVDRFGSNPSWPGRPCLHRMHQTAWVRHKIVPFFCALCLNLVNCSTPATVKQILAQNGKPMELLSWRRLSLSWAARRWWYLTCMSKIKRCKWADIAQQGRSSISEVTCTESLSDKPDLTKLWRMVWALYKSYMT